MNVRWVERHDNPDWAYTLDGRELTCLIRHAEKQTVDDRFRIQIVQNAGTITAEPAGEHASECSCWILGFLDGIRAADQPIDLQATCGKFNALAERLATAGPGTHA